MQRVCLIHFSKMSQIRITFEETENFLCLDNRLGRALPLRLQSGRAVSTWCRPSLSFAFRSSNCALGERKDAEEQRGRRRYTIPGRCRPTMIRFGSLGINILTLIVGIVLLKSSIRAALANEQAVIIRTEIDLAALLEEDGVKHAVLFYRYPKLNPFHKVGRLINAALTESFKRNCKPR